MSTITRESLEALEAAVDMVDLVGGRTPLRRSGARYVGRCPFHDERTPSFSVDPVKKVYYCFGCQRGGDHIAFVRETENLDFAAAVETLADRYGVRLEYEQSSPAEERRRAERGRLLRLLEDAAGFYERYLWESGEAAPARDYLAERGIAEATARDHRLGFSPSAWDRVCAAALAKGFTAAELGQAGLSGRGRRGPVDRFRGRLMFPLADVRGRVRGFGARQMPGGEPPKYLNSPEGPLFRKNEVLYGLDRARSAIATAGHAIVVEGYTDVLALHQSGTANAVASMGTALTEGSGHGAEAGVLHGLPRIRLRRGRRGGVAAGDGAGRGERPLRAGGGAPGRDRIRPTSSSPTRPRSPARSRRRRACSRSASAGRSRSAARAMRSTRGSRRSSARRRPRSSATSRCGWSPTACA